MSRSPRGRAPKPPVAQPTANPERGEHELPLPDGVTYRLRPSKAARRAIEAKTGLAELALIRRGNTGELTLDQLAVIAVELIRAGAEDEITRNVGVEGIGDLIAEAALPAVTARLTLCLWDAAHGGRDTAGNAKAATA